MKKLLFLFLSLMAGMVVNGQRELKVFTEWESTDGTQNFFKRNVTKTDANGNVYVVGSTKNGAGNYDILLAKYNSSGVKQWIQQYAGAGDGEDMGTGLYIDGSGNVYITGTVTTATNVDVITIKYNSSGTQQWVSTYDGTGSTYDSGADLFVDGSGNVYVTGSSYNASSNTDVITIKYNSSGTQQWATRYDYASNLNDAGVKITYSSNIVTVSAVVQFNTTTYKYGVLVYNATTGAITAGRVSSSSTTGIDQVNDMAIDASGNIYIAGATPVTGQGYNFDIIKLNASLGIAWECTYNSGSSLDDIANGIVVDGSGNVYVTGYSTSSTEGKNIATIKYNSSGTQQWVEIYNDTLDGDDAGNAIIKDNAGDIIVTGYVTTAMDSTDYFTIKYNSSGTEQWSILSDGLKHMSDVATNIAIDSTGDIIVTGVSQTSDTTFEYRTVKFVEKQIITPTDYYSEVPAVNFAFYENHGQLINTSDTLIPEVKYYTNNTYPAYYFKDNSFSFVFAHVDTSASTTDTLQRIDVSFPKGGGADANTYPMVQNKDYLNYFLGHCPEGVTEVHGNQRLVMPDVWPNIDVMYTSNQNGIKMYLIIKPGADTGDILLDFEGASGYNIDGSTNAFSINSLIGSLTFDRPTAYQIDNNNVVDTITGWTPDWVQDSDTNRFKFDIGTYDPTETLVIMVDQGHGTFSTTNPQSLEWSTYFGGASNDECADVETDAISNVWVAGNTGPNNFPYVPGTVTIPPYGTKNCFIIKFDELAYVQWLTYFGGSGSERLHEIKVANDGSVLAVGETTSSDFPKMSEDGINISTLQGTRDGFFISFNAYGDDIICDSYIGGDGDDVAYTINLYESSTPANNFVAIGGMSTSATNFPLQNLTGAYNQSSVLGSNDGFIMKLDNNLNKTWCSFFGGSGDESVTDIAINETLSGNFSIAGFTSTNTLGNNSGGVPTNDGFPNCNPGGSAYFQSSYGGGYHDLFITAFNTQNQLSWSTFFGASLDEVELNNLDHPSPRLCYGGRDLYIVGMSSTYASSPLIENSLYSGSYNQPSNNTSSSTVNFILSRFDGTTKEQKWGTFFGGKNCEFNVYDICSDGRGNVFITGEASPEIAANSYCVVPGTDEHPFCDASGQNYMEYGPVYLGSCVRRTYITAFNDQDNLIWSTLYGNDRYNAATGIAANENHLFISGFSGQPFSYTLEELDPTPGSLDYYQNYLIGGFDGVIARFGINEIDNSVEEKTDNNEKCINVSPNPAESQLIVSFECPGMNINKLIVYDAAGKILIEKECDKGENSLHLNIQKLPKGIYLLSALGNDGNRTAIKFIKQ